MSKSHIEWTDQSWNPVVGCSLVSPGCANCYAVADTRRWAAYKTHKGKYEGLVRKRADGTYHFNGTVRFWEPHLEVPLKQRKPSRYFVNSMSDLFHESLSIDDIARVFDVMRRAHWHVFQVLTKRPHQAAKLAGQLPWPPNVLMGTFGESADVLKRIDDLRAVPAARRFLSCEPLIGPVGKIDLTGIDWVIAGGESGARSKVRPLEVDWIREIRDQCIGAGIAFSFKQFGRLSNNPDPLDPTTKENGGATKGGRTLDGMLWDQHPAVAGYAYKEAIGLASPSPLTDAEFHRVAHLLPGHATAAGGRGRDNRAFLEAVRWQAYTLKPWRSLPGDHAKWNTHAVRVKRWHEGGHWPAILAELQDPIVARFIASYAKRSKQKRQQPTQRTR
ncbi:MAG TPA: DUF5131 family protein [Rubricoccaceae bacterium]|jgi:protein gp37/transposase